MSVCLTHFDCSLSHSQQPQFRLCFNHRILILLHPTCVFTLLQTHTCVTHHRPSELCHSFKMNSRSEARLVGSGEKPHYIRKIRKEQDVEKANKGQQRAQHIALCKANAPWGWDLDFQSTGIPAKNHSQAGSLPHGPWQRRSALASGRWHQK